MKNTLLYIGCILAFSSCDIFLPLPVESNEEPPKLVINGVIDAQGDETLLVNISQTQPLVRDTNTIWWEEIYITDAIVLLFENEILIDTLQHTESGNYLPSFNFEPTLEAFYYLEVFHPKFENVATLPVKMPSLPSIRTIHREQISNVNRDRITYTLENEVNVSDYYEISVLTERDNSGAFGKSYIQHGTYEEYLQEPNCGLGQTVFSDICFDGEAFTQEIQIYNTRVTQMIFECSAVSESYFRYIQNQESSTSGDPVTQIFTEPATYYSNVENGYGVFYARNKLMIEL